MATTLCLLTCALWTGQPAGAPDWTLIPRLRPGQELVYRGTYTEEFTGPGVQFNRAYRLESRVFVTDTPAQGTDIALLTGLKLQTPRAGGASAAVPEPGSVRLELARVDLRGRVTAVPGTSLTVPLQGPATAESGAFVEVPQAHLNIDQTWATAEDGRPPRTWHVAGSEAVGGTLCLKVVGDQQSSDWDHPRADSTAWRRRDTVWLTPALGVACKVERVIERREPARLEPTERLVTSYELQSAFVYPELLCQERVLEVRQARALAATAEPMLREPGRFAPRDFDIFLQRVAYQLDNQPESPYHDVLRQLRRRVEAARRGETPVSVPADVPAAAPATAVGDPAPQFMFPSLTGSEPVRSSRLRGRPALLIFFSPTSPTLGQVLRFGQAVAESLGPAVTVVGLSVGEDNAGVIRDWAEWKLTYPLVSGRGLRQTFDVDSTPKLVVLDGAGTVRGSYVGWATDMAAEVRAELRRWLTPSPPP